jgi:hypothetical protein
MLVSNPSLPHSRPGMSSSSTSSTRLKVNFDTGSVSDSGVVSRTLRSSHYLDVSLPGRLRLSPLDVRHPSPSCPSIPQPSYLSECGSPERSPSLLHASRLDVKRLLSKPAAPSVTSTLSITSDSESHTIPRAQLNSEAWPSKSRIQGHVKLRFGSLTIPRAESSERSPAQSPLPPPPQQRARNLLRKKSASGHMHATMTATSPRRMSISSPLQSIVRPPAAAPSGSQRSTVLQSVLGSRAVVPASAPSHGSGKLTPAGAIAQAYKEQDVRREALAAAARAEGLLPTVPTSVLWLDSPEHTSEHNATPTAEEGAPSQTAPGGSPGRIAAVDIAFCHADDHNPDMRCSGSQPVKSLTRKVSARLRRGLATISGAGTGDGDGEGEQRNTLRGDLKGGNSPNQYKRERSTYVQKAKRKPESLRLSIDQPSAHPPSGRVENSSDRRSGQPVPSESAQDSTSLVAQSEGKDGPYENDDTSAGGKLWRLVKRISAGGLRERFQSVSTPAPPVPAIPKDLLPLPPATLEGQALTAPDSTSGHRGAEGGYSGDGEKSVEGHFFLDSNPSMSGLSPSSDGHPFIATSTPSVATHGHDANLHLAGRSTSSSPQSSEPTSTQFFRGSHTPRSSFSSIIGTSPPVPAQAQSPSPPTRSRAKSCSSSRAHHPSTDERQSSSPPQMRTRQRSSPDIPTFSVADVVNNFIMRRPSLVRHQRRHVSSRSLPKIVAPPPERVGVSPQRPAPSGPCNVAQQHDRVDPMLNPGSSARPRNSHSSGGSTVRASSASPHTISSGTSTGSRSGARLTFREVGSSRRQAWTSQEKEDRWDDLLERSERAGGTLHLGAGSARLPSDNIRFSSSTFASEVVSNR